MPHQEIDDQPATGRSQGCLFDMDLVAVYRVATAHALQRPDLPHDGDTKNAVAVSHKAHVPALNIVSSENGPARAARVDCRDRHCHRDAHGITRLPALTMYSSMNA